LKDGKIQAFPAYRKSIQKELIAFYRPQIRERTEENGKQKMKAKEAALPPSCLPHCLKKKGENLGGASLVLIVRWDRDAQEGESSRSEDSACILSIEFNLPLRRPAATPRRRFPSFIH